MSIRELPKSDKEQEHRDWITNATIEELDEYIAIHSETPTFYRMALAQRNKLHFHKLKKSHWTMTPMFWLVLASFLLALLLGWKKIEPYFEFLFPAVFPLYQ